MFSSIVHLLTAAIEVLVLATIEMIFRLVTPTSTTIM